MFKEFKPDYSILQKMALIPLFAFVGLGSDGLSSSCYGPEEAFRVLGGVPNLIIYVALMQALTILALCVSYSQIIELFPRGGGGYVVASKLLSSKLGLISGCALLVDYILTITISIASGVDAIFSLFPSEYQEFKQTAKILSVVLLTILNMRGIKESVFPWVPIFFLFLFTHFFGFAWAFYHHADGFGAIARNTFAETSHVTGSIGYWGLLFLLLKSYSMGAGTFTGIEAVSNGMRIIREPKIPNAKRTMAYIGVALTTTVSGLILCYLLYGARPQEQQTLNAVLFSKIGGEMGGVFGMHFEAITVFSETALLFVAAETGFLGGPQILANMAVDRWFPHEFIALSDRLVMRHGVILMGGAACLVMLYTAGSVNVLVVLYSLSVFITFTLSQTGMVSHWWKSRNTEPQWIKKILINGISLLLTFFILVSLILVKFLEGAWLTLLVVGALVLLGMVIRRYYDSFRLILTKIHRPIPPRGPAAPPMPKEEMMTAVFWIGGIPGLTEHSVANVVQAFGSNIGHFIFLQVGILDVESFKGEDEIHSLQDYAVRQAQKLVKIMEDKGYTAEARVSLGLDIADEIERMAVETVEKYPHSIFFGGQLVLPKDNMVTRYLHNQTLYVIQRRLFRHQFPFITVPVYLKSKDEKTMGLMSALPH